MLRVTLLLLLALVLAAGASACGGGEDETTAPETVETGDGTETETETEGETETAGGSGEGNADRGKEIFAAQGCGSCHTLADAGTSGSVGPNLDESQPDFELVVDRVTNGAGAMPPFADKLSEDEIRDVAAYVSTAAGD
jgi:mono/diheme cytochrome c family protein